MAFGIKNHSISSGPNHPASSNDNFSEDAAIKINSCLANHIQRLKIYVPGNVDRVPTSSTERAGEEEVEACSF